MSADQLEELRAQKLRQRLWGATIIIALAVIFLPLLLDGSGSESQFRRVERLREEPPRVINIDGSRETVTVPLSNTSKEDSWWQRMKRRFSENPPGTGPVRRTTDQSLVDSDDSLPASQSATRRPVVDNTVTPVAVETESTAPVLDNNSFKAWVVQAGSFRDEANAMAVRDRLRRAGYPSFVTLSNDGTVFRVRVGPMIDKDQAGTVRDDVISLLGRDALVMPYP